MTRTTGVVICLLAALLLLHCDPLRPASSTSQQFTRDGINVRDFGAVGNGQTDDTAALQAAIDAGSNAQRERSTAAVPQRVYIPAGKYLISSTLRIPPVSVIDGAGKWATMISAGKGFTGVMVQDTGNAAKIRLRDFQINAVGEPNVTDLLNLGNEEVPWGTEGELSHLLLRGSDTGPDHHSGQTGLRLKGNAGQITDLSVWDCDNSIIESPDCTATYYDGLWLANFGGTGTCMRINYARIAHAYMEIGQGVTALYVARAASIGTMEVSSTRSASHDHLIEIDLAAVSFDAQNITYWSGGSTASLTNFIKDNRGTVRYWGDPNPGAKTDRYAHFLSDTRSRPSAHP